MFDRKWDESLSVGVRKVDVEHKRLFLLLRRLQNGLRCGAGENLSKNLDNLAEEAASHFLDEERLLLLTDFPAARPHEREHAQLLLKVSELQFRLRAGEAGALSIEVVNGISDWFERHIRESDKEFSAYLNLRGIR